MAVTTLASPEAWFDPTTTDTDATDPLQDGQHHQQGDDAAAIGQEKWKGPPTSPNTAAIGKGPVGKVR